MTRIAKLSLVTNSVVLALGGPPDTGSVPSLVCILMMDTSPSVDVVFIMQGIVDLTELIFNLV